MSNIEDEAMRLLEEILELIEDLNSKLKRLTELTMEEEKNAIQ